MTKPILYDLRAHNKKSHLVSSMVVSSPAEAMRLISRWIQQADVFSIMYHPREGSGDEGLQEVFRRGQYLPIERRKP